MGEILKLQAPECRLASGRAPVKHVVWSRVVYMHMYICMHGCAVILHANT